ADVVAARRGLRRVLHRVADASLTTWPFRALPTLDDAKRKHAPPPRASPSDQRALALLPDTHQRTGLHDAAVGKPRPPSGEPSRPGASHDVAPGAPTTTTHCATRARRDAASQRARDACRGASAFHPVRRWNAAFSLLRSGRARRGRTAHR